MSFLHPMLLAGLPLVALPIVIHLVNQRRYQTMRWAAMMFLLAANKMSRGYARLRQWLIMAARMLAIAGLIFAVSRPLLGGWLGLGVGSRPDTTIVLLDRSPSMRQGGRGAGGSKLETGRLQLSQALKTIGSARWVLIEGASNKPREWDTIEALLSSPAAGPTDAPSDIAAMLQSARDYIRDNKAGNCEIWICSDLRENDWNPEGARWKALKDAFLEFPQAVRFHLLAYPQPEPGNLAIRVTDVRRQDTSDGAEVAVSLKLSREGGGEGRRVVPVQFEIDGARSVVSAEMAGPRFELKDHRLPLARGKGRGWGRVSIPGDANPADDDFYFAFDRPAPRLAVVVAEDAQAARPLQVAAEVSPDPSITCSAEVVAPEALATVEWAKVSLLLWQGPLPEGEVAKAVRAFVARGGYAVFFPPKTPDSRELFGVKWKRWTESNEDVPVAGWRGDQDLLAHTQSGAPLPVGQLQVRRHCAIEGETSALATLKGGTPLLSRVATNAGGVYFCATTPAPSDSSLAMGGVVFYVAVQRALAGGAAVLDSTRQLVAGEPSGDDPSRWRRLGGDEDALSTDYPLHRGVYASGTRLLAVNRPAAEDQAPVVADRRLAELFKGLDFARVDDQAGNTASFLQEGWRLFLVAMMAALLAEAGLCLPRPHRDAGGAP